MSRTERHLELKGKIDNGTITTEELAELSIILQKELDSYETAYSSSVQIKSVE